MPHTASQNRHRDDFLRHSAGVLVCPRCGIPLQGGDHELGIAWRCRACGGQSLNFSQFRRLVPERGANEIWLEAAAKPGIPKSHTRCPECLAAMDAVQIPFRGGSVELDICRRCQRLWLDRHEDSAIPSLPAGGNAAALLPAAKAALPTPQQQRDQLFSMLEDFADYSDSRRERSSEREALIFGISAGVVTWLCLWTFPLRFYVAWGVGLAVYAWRKLRR
jgi:Zn-finger nucleic acid-binding protein